MAIPELATLLADRTRIGLDDALVQALRLEAEDATRARLRTRGEPHRAVHLLGAYVVDDTDALGKGEVYWWSIPMLGSVNGTIHWDALVGLPTGALPATVGSHEWMDVSLATPPLLLVIPPGDETTSGLVHLAFFDDDWEPAKLAPAMREGLRALSKLTFPAPDTDAVVAPIRKAIHDSLQGKRDDRMFERTLRFARDEGRGYGVGSIASASTEFVRVYWLVRDAARTEQCGPWWLKKGAEQRVLPSSGLAGGGMLALFARGGTVNAEGFGTVTTDTPFLNVAIESRHQKALADGLLLTAEGDAEVVAYYTPR